MIRRPLSFCALPLLALALMGPSGAFAASRSQQTFASGAHDKEMLSLAPGTRMEQRCNARAMGEVGRGHKDLHPDELVAYAFADTVTSDTAVKAPGAAVRSGGKWYRLSYSCRTSPDGMTVLSFEYSLGDVVPKSDWSAHYLVP
ncbi:DUF930 domain-containing protein [Roseixanthobacter liquoris]|uniref:DUF930 domain-containing protein n=1 Tax=Roseixanthobacter liquoris TaxID=3119921 RepID=UPI00372C4198